MPGLLVEVDVVGQELEKNSNTSRTILTGFGHFHGSIRSGPIQVASTLGDHFAAVASKLSGTQSRLSQSLYALKEFAAICLARNGARLKKSQHLTMKIFTNYVDIEHVCPKQQRLVSILR